MRTTVTLADDVAAAVKELRRKRGLGLSEALNELVRAGLRQRPQRNRLFRQESSSIGLTMDVTDVAEAIELLEGPAAHPLSPAAAWSHVEAWLAAEPAWVPAPTDRHAEILGGLVTRHDLHSNLISDAELATLAIEHGLTICSADTDFARFAEVKWL